MNRGIAKEDVAHYLDPTALDVLDPGLIARIDDGVKMLIKHISANDKIFLTIDSDCDGFTSAALLVNYLNRLFPSFVQNNISYALHEGKQHGIIMDKVASDVKLVIAPDASSNEYDFHKELADRGIDVLVIDHHEAEHISEYACVINNQLCDYPTKSLSGVGMVYKFCCRIDQYLHQDIANDFVDLVAVGVVGDVMDLRDYETKYLVMKGCSAVRNPHLKARVAASDFVLKGALTPFGISFYVAPFINAVNRSGTASEKMLIFESMLEYKAYEMIPSTKRGCSGQMETRVEQAIRTSNNIKNRQTKAEDASSATIENLIEKNNLLNNKILVVTIPAAQAIDANLAGLIANQMASKYQKPTLILNERFHDNETYWEGSGRNFANSPLDNFRTFLIDLNLFEYASGHESAFGVSIKASRMNDFINISNEKLKNFDFSPKYLIDFEFDRSDSLNLSHAILDLGSLKKHWGQGVEEPLISIKNISITKDNLKLMGKNQDTIKITIPGDEGIELIKFRSSEDEYDALYSETGCVTINVIGTCEINSWSGCSPQVTIKDYEIIGKVDYYF